MEAKTNEIEVEMGGSNESGTCCLVINLFWENLEKAFSIKVVLFSQKGISGMCVGVGLDFGVSPRINVSFAFVSQCDHVVDS